LFINVHPGIAIELFSLMPAYDTMIEMSCHLGLERQAIEDQVISATLD
jgi:hypothetical protein